MTIKISDKELKFPNFENGIVRGTIALICLLPGLVVLGIMIVTIVVSSIVAYPLLLIGYMIGELLGAYNKDD